MYFAFDTETTDLPRVQLHLAHPAQPHLIQFAGILFDNAGNEIERLSTLVKPRPGAVLAHKAFEAHGISLEEASERGADPELVLSWFIKTAAKAKLIIGHNVNFDIHIMRVLAARLRGIEWTPRPPLYCTMINATPVVNLPPTARMVDAGRFEAKPPTLSECMRHFFGEDPINAHDAYSDVKACIRVYRELVRLTEATV